MERMPSKAVLDVVEKACGRPIVASDLATQAGISLSQSRKDLTTLASLSRGDIAVSVDAHFHPMFPQYDRPIALSVDWYRLGMARFFRHCFMLPNWGLVCICAITTRLLTIVMMMQQCTEIPIRNNGGAVTTEQLAPFCDDILLPNDSNIEGKLGEERAYVDESFVLPIVSQLDGVPQVTDAHLSRVDDYLLIINNCFSLHVFKGNDGMCPKRNHVG
eukprot:scaffold42601_cov36-Cyclotella_meneghiniana.AAC.2